MESGDAIDNRLFVLVLQHPREKKETLATAALTVAMLRRAELVVGLSWPNLGRVLGRPADPGRWAVLYLGSVRPRAFGLEHDVIAVDPRVVSFRTSCSAIAGTCKAGASPNTTPTKIEMPKAKKSTRPSIPISFVRGTVSGITASAAFVAHAANSRPSAPPAAESRMLSVSN